MGGSQHLVEHSLVSIAAWFAHSGSVLRRVGSSGAQPCLASARRASARALRARRGGAGRSHGPYPPPTDPRSPHRATPLSHKRSLHPCTPPHGVTRPHADTTHAPRHDDAREVHAGWSWGGRTVRGDRPRSQGHRLGVVFASLALRIKYTVYPPSQTYQQHALAGGGSGLWGSSCRPSACGRRWAPSRWRTGSMDGGGSRCSFVIPSRLVQLCHEWRRSSRRMRSLHSSCAPWAEGLHHTRWPCTTGPYRPAPPGRRVALRADRRR